MNAQLNPDSYREPVRREKAGAVINGCGILVVDKPEGITSFDVVARVKKGLGVRKTGHCGTLDPFATGVLIVCIDEATRIADQFVHQDKIYRFTARFGVETDTLDKTGRVTQCRAVEAPAEPVVREVLKGFEGPQVQKVPKFAAVRVGGRRLYELSRKGIEVERPERAVHIHRLDLCDWTWPRAVLEVCCSKGTYVRQLASDIGDRLGCGAHVEELRRLAVGPFTVDQAVGLDEIGMRAGSSENRVFERIIPMGRALDHLPAVPIEDERVLSQLRNGRLDPALENELRPRFCGHSGAVRLMAAEQTLAALWWPEATEEGRRLRVFNL